MQYAQQALSRPLVEQLKRTYPLNQLLGFDNQIPNQEMAQIGSLSGDLATLDLSEASDRVMNCHVLTMMESAGIFRDAVQDCRSGRADVLGEVITLSKFASMGSALTFPIEAMFFLCLIMMGIEHELKRPLTAKDVKSLVGVVRVYGDDIIVPVEYVSSVIAVLEDYSLKVNARKSFWSGSFRESCGKEYYKGHDVSIVKVRSLLPSSRSDTRQIVSTVSLRNQLYMAGYWGTAKWIDDYLGRLIPFPIVESTSAGLGRHSYIFPYQKEREHKKLQSPLVRAMVVTYKIPRRETDGVSALLKWFLKDGDEPFFDKNHLLVSGRPISVSINSRWVSPF